MYIYIYVYVYIQRLDKIIGILVKFKESLFKMELVLFQASVQLQFV